FLGVLLCDRGILLGLGLGFFLLGLALTAGFGEELAQLADALGVEAVAHLEVADNADQGQKVGDGDDRQDGPEGFHATSSPYPARMTAISSMASASRRACW